MPQSTTLELLGQTVSSRVTTIATGVGQIAVTNVGSGYATTPNVTISSTGAGSGAVAVATLDSYYGTIPRVLVTAPGTNYTQVPTVAIEPPPGSGTPATAVAFLNAVVVGVAQQAASFYIGNRNLQTITWWFSNATAYIEIQASLATQPSESDWVVVYVLQPSSSYDTSFYNLPGTFVWLRAVVKNFTQGTIQYIKMTY